MKLASFYFIEVSEKDNFYAFRLVGYIVLTSIILLTNPLSMGDVANFTLPC